MCQCLFRFCGFTFSIALHSILHFHVSVWDSYLSAWRTLISISFNYNLLAINSHSYKPLFHLCFWRVFLQLYSRSTVIFFEHFKDVILVSFAFCWKVSYQLYFPLLWLLLRFFSLSLVFQKLNRSVPNWFALYLFWLGLLELLNCDLIYLFIFISSSDNFDQCVLKYCFCHLPCSPPLPDPSFRTPFTCVTSFHWDPCVSYALFCIFLFSFGYSNSLG